MEENKQKKETQKKQANADIKQVKKDVSSSEKSPKKESPKTRPQNSQNRRDKGSFYRGGSKKRPQNSKRRSFRGKRGERARPEYDQKIISIRRVTRVVAGGRRFTFSVALVAGNRNGKVGVGVGKATDTALAIEKAFKNAKKNMVDIKRNKDKSISHEVSARYCTSQVFVKPALGKGIVAGSSARNVLTLAGITDVSSKILSRSKNKINIARATVTALGELAD